MMILIVWIIFFFRLNDFGVTIPAWFPNGNDLLYRIIKRTLVFFGLFLVLFVTTSSHIVVRKSQADLKKMSDEQLSEVTGANLLNFVIEKGQTDVSGSFTPNCGWHCTSETYDYRVNNSTGDRETHFARIEADIQLDADQGGFSEAFRIDNLRMGHYDDSNRIGDDEGGYITGTGDGTAGESFYYGPNFSGFNGCYRQGCSNNDDSNSFDVNSDGLVIGTDGSPVRAEGPYLEFAFEQFGSGGNEELVGMRLGFEKIQGEASIANISQISTTIRAQDFNDGGNCTAAGHRMTDCPTTLGANALGLFNILRFGGSNSSWGDSDGWTEDFWISFNKKDMFWRHQNPEAGTTDASEARFNTDGEGFWLHATDDVEGGVS